MKDKPPAIVEDFQLTPEPTSEKRKPLRHVSVAIRHLQTQRKKAVDDRDKAAKQVEDLDHALQALGYPEDDDE